MIIDSSIWVATITGFALRRALSMMSFWWIGTSSSGHSTPRSPRATMTPSKASTISSMLSIAWGFSILAMMGTKMFSSVMIARTSSASDALRTKLSAMKSTPSRRAQRRSAVSFSDRAGTETATPGRLMPLLLETLPGTTTSVTTSVSSTDVTSRRTLPSSMSNGSPGFTSPGRPLYVVPQCSTSPTTSRVVIVNVAPFLSLTGPSPKVSRRIFGPWRSAKMPIA